ncbi:putative AP-5 complex subunit beta-1 protein [Helianthus debilis subsp. tardiflorus]
METTPSPAPVTPLKPLTPQEWESLIDDYQHGGSRWISLNYSGQPLFDLSLSSILRKDLALNLKLLILTFLEEHVTTILTNSSIEQNLDRLLETLRYVINSPVDAVTISYSLKEQVLISTTSIFIMFTIDNYNHSKMTKLTFVSQLEGLVEVLLTVVNRPSYGIDRQLRGVGCECLRELERECPGLLSETVGSLWELCQSEKTHVAQSYVLMLANVVHGIVVSKVNVSVLSSVVPLVPFNVPQVLVGGSLGRESSGLAVKELRRVMSFLLEWPQYLTPFGLFEFMSVVMPVAVALELQASLLKVQFSGLLFTSDMLLCHAYLGMYLQFPEAFSGHENEVIRRVSLISREAQNVLVFRLLALHWLLGFMGMVMSKREVDKEKIFATALRFYPTVFDPLALKALKLDLIVYCSVILVKSRLEDANGEGSVVKLFEDAFESVSGFKWLPSWSTETSVAFRTFHKLLIGESSHSESGSSTRDLVDSTIFHATERMLVTMTLESRGLIPVMAAFINRLLKCHKHRFLGQQLLQTFDNHLLPKVKVDYRLGSYFPLFGKIAENVTVPPGGLLDLLGKYMSILIEKHGIDTGLRSWSQGSKVLVLCRTLLMHHQSSRIFLKLSRLLAFTCLHFPDLEVRDNARIYLRMLLCVPGNKLRHLLSTEDQIPSSHSTPFFTVQSPRFSYDSKKSKDISSYIHLERVVPLLVKQSWSLSLASFNVNGEKPYHMEVITDSNTNTPSWHPETPDNDTETPSIPALEGPNQSQEPLRVTDSKVSEIVEILRKHFSLIPDFRHMPGIKIGITCTLRFESEPFNRVWGNKRSAEVDTVDLLHPALYATVLKFSSSAPFGSIQPYRIPFLLGSPTKNMTPSSQSQTDSLDIVPVNNGIVDEEKEDDESFNARVLIELQPREPTPGLVDVSIEANAENGQIISGQLQSITVGIEDMFLKVLVPDDIRDDEVPRYYVNLFNALWEACSSSSSTAREMFLLKGGKGVTAINGTRSVKFLEVSATSLIQAVEKNLSAFVVNVFGVELVNIVKDGGIISDVTWNDDDDGASGSGSGLDVVAVDPYMTEAPLYLKYDEEEDEKGSNLPINKRNMGRFHILIFLPPTSHLLFQMEVGVNSTLVRIRTDHWPCLAYIDDYLEALFLA